MKIPIIQPDIPDFRILENIMQPAVNTGHLSNFGPIYDKAREMLRTRLQLNADQDVVITSSGHTALMTAYKIFNVKKIVIPSYTFPSTSQAAVSQGIKVITTDVNPHSGCITREILEKVPLRKYDAVVAVCALSTIPDLYGLQTYCRQHGKTLIIDAAPAFGTGGICGDAVCYSFHATKTLSAGEGGAIVIPKLLEPEARSFINFGFDVNKNPSADGINAKASEYTCAIIVALLKTIHNAIGGRIGNAHRYNETLSGYLPKSFAGFRTVYQIYPIFTKEPQHAQMIREALTAAKIGNLRYYKPLNPAHIVAKHLYDTNICLPVHQFVTKDDVDKVIEVIKQATGKYYNPHFYKQTS